MTNNVLHLLLQLCLNIPLSLSIIEMLVLIIV